MARRKAGFSLIKNAGLIDDDVNVNTMVWSPFLPGVL